MEAAEAEAKTAHLEKLETLNQALSNLSADTFTVDADASAEAIKAVAIEAEKALKKAQSATAVEQANQLLESAHTIESGLKVLIAKVDAPDPNALKSMVAHLAGQLGESLVLLGTAIDGKVSLCAQASPKAVEAGHKAGDIIRELTGKLGGKGGGKPNFAMGGAPDNGALESEISNKAQSILG